MAGIIIIPVTVEVVSLVVDISYLDRFFILRFTFECRLPSDTPKPKIEWFKDDMPLTSPDYQTSYHNGIVTLTIEETFSEDTAIYTCKATTDVGTIETSATLTVRGQFIIDTLG